MVAQALLDSDVRHSTAKISNLHWKAFVNYCQDLDIDPTTCPPQIVANFLAILRTGWLNGGGWHRLWDVLRAQPEGNPEEQPRGNPEGQPKGNPEGQSEGNPEVKTLVMSFFTNLASLAWQSESQWH
jgi:hypothetical protein